MFNFPEQALWIALWQTVYMVIVSGFLSIFFGSIIGIFLFISRPDQVWPHTIVHRLLELVVNITRSIPYVILMIAIIPLTRWLVGTSIGTNAAIVSLTLAAIPFYARITENALSEVPVGLIETAQAMGASHFHLIMKVLIPEALSPLINGATLTLITLIGYSTMAGAVGGGGLGELAIDYGYQRFNPQVMLVTVILLVLVVQCVQSVGNRLTKRPKIKPLLSSAVLIFLICLGIPFCFSHHSGKSLKVGVIAGEEEEVMKVAERVAWQRYHLRIQTITFTDYVLPNQALNNGDIDANIFQHQPFLEAQIKAQGFKLISIAKTFIYPMGLYSKKIQALTQLPSGALVGIPEDPSNEGRALLLLQQAGLIKLKSGVGLMATVYDIVSNPDHLKIKTLDAAQLPRLLDEAYLVALNNNFAKVAGFTVNQALVKESADSPYANIIVVREQDKNNPKFKDLIAAMHSKPVVREVERLFPDGAAIPAWQP